LIDALVVEPDRHTAGRKEHGHSVAMHQCTGVIELKSLAPVQLDREDAKRGAPYQTIQNLFEVLGSHFLSQSLASEPHQTGTLHTRSSEV